MIWSSAVFTLVIAAAPNPCKIRAAVSIQNESAQVQIPEVMLNSKTPDK